MPGLPATRHSIHPVALLTAVLLGCSPGDDGAWTVLDEGLDPAELRVVRVDDEGTVWAVGYHGGRLDGFLLRGRDGVFEEVPLPADLLRDHALVDICRADASALWLAGTAHLFRLADDRWQVFDVPEDVVDGVTACAFTTDGHGLLVGQGWDGPRIHAFDDGTFTDEPLADSVEDPGDISLARVLARADFGYAAGVRRSDQRAVLLLRRADGWSSVALPADAGEIGPLRDLAWHAGGPEIWAVGDRALKGDAGSLEVADFPYSDGFTPRVVAFPGQREGWIAGFGETAVYHERFGGWGDVPADRLAPDLAEGITRAWLIDDADFPRRTDGWLVGEFADCDGDGECEGGQAILHYDRNASTIPWVAEGDWSRPADEGDAGPGVAVEAVAVDGDGVYWLAGDANPAAGDPWGEPQLWRRAPGEAWAREPLPGGAGLADLHVGEDGTLWAVGSRPGEGEDQSNGVVLRLGAGWEEELVDDFVASDWELNAVTSAADGTAWAVGRRNAFPLALVRDDGVWRIVDLDDFEGSTSLADVALDAAGTVWVVGDAIPGSGGTEGFMAAGSPGGLVRVDVAGLGRQCGASPCWTLTAVAARGSRVVAVGEGALLDIGGGAPASTDTNMTLRDVALPDDGPPWVLAENGWWEPDGDDGWTVHRHWDPQSGEGISRRLAVADEGFTVIAGHRQRVEDGAVQILHAVLVAP